jgi:hypothetical protein
MRDVIYNPMAILEAVERVRIYRGISIWLKDA